MDAQKYCETVDQKVLVQKKLIEAIPVKDNHSPLISLKECGYNLIFEPSIQKNYAFLVREAVVEKIGRISRELDKESKALIIRSGWRSYKHQQLLWDNFYKLLHNQYPGKHKKEIREMVANYIALEKKSMHSTGGAVDALIYDLKSECIMDFGTNDGYKINLIKESYPYHPDISPVAKKNRKLLIGLFEKEDFVCDLREYWHFDYGNVVWAVEKKKKFAIYDIIAN